MTNADYQKAADLLRELAALVSFDDISHVIERPEEMDILIAELDSAARTRTADDALREIHRYLYPENYPADQVADHPDYSPDDDCYKWHAGTIDDVAEMVSRALADDPATPKGE